MKENFLKIATQIAQQAGQLTLELADNLDVKEKTKNDWVTNADLATEDYIIKEIKKHFPNHGILGEESTNLNTAPEALANHPYIWIIDPIDGTKNYAKGLPVYGISIAIFHNTAYSSSKNYQYLQGELIAGVIEAPKLNQTFHALKGQGAYQNNNKIKVSKVKDIKNSFLATGFPPGKKTLSLKYFNKATKTVCGVRRMGAASLDMAYLAAGALDGFWEFGLKPWDIAAGSLLISEAGGKLSDTNGEHLDLFGEDILASNSTIHKQLINLFSTIK